MTIAADLGDGTRFAETENPTVPSPCPFSAATVTQFESAETVQVQSRVVLTPMVPLPPLDGKGVDGAFVTVTLHLVPEGALTDVDVWLQSAAIAAHATSAPSSCFKVLLRCTTFGLMHAARQAGPGAWSRQSCPCKMSVSSRGISHHTVRSRAGSARAA